MATFRKVMWLTAGVIGVMGVLSPVLIKVSRTLHDPKLENVGNGTLIVAYILVGAAIIAAIVLAILREKDLAAGVLAGAGIGLLVTFVSCFAAVMSSFG